MGRRRWEFRDRDQYRLLRIQVLERWGGGCLYCGSPCGGCATMDHVVPIADGGRDELENLVPACEGCNQRKGGKSFVEFLAEKAPYNAVLVLTRIQEVIAREEEQAAAVPAE